jgi:hypothetical protein
MTILGLFKTDLEKPTTQTIQEVHVHDGNGGSAKVCVGDQVEIFNPVKNKRTLDFLGPGPYTIEELGRWKCGREYVQLTTRKKGTGNGVNASKLKIVS